MNDESDGTAAEPTWWYALGEREHGPVFEADMGVLLAAGEISRETLVWREPMADWAPLGETALGSTALGDLPPPHAPREIGEPRVGELPAGFVREDVGMIILLSIVTCGIYGLIIFYRAGKGYAKLAGRDGNFDGYFWTYVGMCIGTMFFFPLLLGVWITGWILLKETLELRDEVTPSGLELTPTSSHTAYWLLGQILGVILVGLVFSIIQAVNFFNDHNLLYDRLRDATSGDSEYSVGKS